MRELKLLSEWADSIIGKYNIGEGFDALSPVTGKITKDEIRRFRANNPINKSTKLSKGAGPSPEIRNRLKQLRDEFASMVSKGKSPVAETDQPPQGSLYSPLSAASRDDSVRDPKAKIKQRREAKQMRRFMGHRD